MLQCVFIHHAAEDTPMADRNKLPSNWLCPAESEDHNCPKPGLAKHKVVSAAFAMLFWLECNLADCLLVHTAVKKATYAASGTMMPHGSKQKAECPDYLLVLHTTIY